MSLLRRAAAGNAIILAACILIFAAIYTNLAVVVALSCLGMVGCDFFGVLLGVGEARGQEDIAGMGDVGGDFFGKFLLAGWAGSTLTHGNGWEGWLCIVPILVTGFFTTKYVTRWAKRIKVRSDIAVEVSVEVGGVSSPTPL